MILISENRNIPDPLVHSGRHFGRVTYAFCNIRVLITNGLMRMNEEDPEPLESAKYVHPPIVPPISIKPFEVTTVSTSCLWNYSSHA